MRQANKRILESAEKTVRDIRRATRRHHSAEEKIRIVLEGLRGEEPFGERLGLRKQRPRPESRGQPLVGPLPGVCGRKNVKESQTLHSLRVIERKTIRGTTAPIMPGD